MYKSNIKAHYRKNNVKRLCQGDIFQDVTLILGSGHSGEISAKNFELPYAVILTQDCDLDRDYINREDSKKDKTHDKYLQSILLSPAYQFDKFCTGSHIPNQTMEQFNTKSSEKIKQNDFYDRYHYLPEALLFGIPELVIDFKHYYTIPRSTLYDFKNSLYLTSLSELFRERLSQRFANYLSRIGLPELKPI